MKIINKNDVKTNTNKINEKTKQARIFFSQTFGKNASATFISS